MRAWEYARHGRVDYELLKVGAIEPVVFRSLSFAEAKSGMRLMESRALHGKVVLVS